MHVTIILFQVLVDVLKLILSRVHPGHSGASVDVLKLILSSVHPGHSGASVDVLKLI